MIEPGEKSRGIFARAWTLVWTLGGALDPDPKNVGPTGRKGGRLREAAAGALTALALFATFFAFALVLYFAVALSLKYLGLVKGAITLMIAAYIGYVAATSREIGRMDARGVHNLYLRRFYLTPRFWSWVPVIGNRRFFLHHILRSDDDAWGHDHPWAFTSLILWGKYIEHDFHPTEIRQWAIKLPRVLSHERHATPGTILRNQATHTHKIEIVRPVWSLVLAGAGERDWGFWVMDGTGPDRWVQWEEYLGIKKGTGR